jgi:hypothetical protein
MVATSSAFHKTQIGKETGFGVQATPSAVLLGTFTHKENPSFYTPEEDTGLLAKYTRSAKVGTIAELVRNGSLTFEQTLYFFLMGVKGGITPTKLDADLGEVHAYEWDFARSLVEANARDSFTIVSGNAKQAFFTTGCLARDLEIKGAKNEPLMLTASVFGQNFDKTDFEEAIDLPTVEDVITKKGKVYINDTGATIGTSQKSQTVAEFTLKIPTALEGKDFLDGNLWHSDYSEDATAIELDMTVQFNDTVNAEYENYSNGVKRFIRLEFEGSTIVTTFKKKLTLDLCGIYTGWDGLGKQDGMSIVNVKLASIYDATWDNDWNVKVVNALAVLP